MKKWFSTRNSLLWLELYKGVQYFLLYLNTYSFLLLEIEMKIGKEKKKQKCQISQNFIPLFKKKCKRLEQLVVEIVVKYQIWK